MPIEEAEKSALVQGFTSVLRQSSLNGAVDVQRLGMAFRMTLDHIEPGQPIDLQHLYDYLHEQKLEEAHVIELCLALKFREDRLGVRFSSPSQLQYLSPDKVEKIIAKFNAREKTGGGGYEKKAPEGAVPRGSSGPEPTRPEKRKKQGAKGPKTKVYLAILIATVFSGVGFFSWRQSTLEEPVAEQQPPQDSAGLKCVTYVRNDKVAYCTITKLSWIDMSKDTLDAKAGVTKRAAKVEKLFVKTDDGKVRMIKKD